jgi:two-component system chemotaxis response regulator CheY
MGTMKTCLVVDDSRVVRKVARRILEELQFEVAEAEDGQQALEYCRKSLPEGVLLDWNMPVMDGLAFMKEMRKLPKGAGVKVVFCTTRNELPSVQEALAEGADEYIMKPFDREMLESKFLQVGLL